jgi:hypothetical protein
MPRRTIALTLIAATIVAAPLPAGAVDRPRACVALSVTAPRCHPSATFERGRPVALRASEPGTVWRRAPRGRWFVAMGRTDRRGQWTWTPIRRDVHPAAPYTFRVTTAAGTTNPVEVWIVPRHG